MQARVTSKCQPSPPCRHCGRVAAQSFSAPAAPTRSAGHVRVPRGSVASLERRECRGRSICPRCRAAAGLFRHSGVKLEAQVAVSAPGTRDSSYSRTGPNGVTAARRNVVGVESRDSRLCWARRTSCRRLFAPQQLEEDRRLRWLGRAGRVNWRGREFAPPAGMPGRTGAVFGASRRLRGCVSSLW